MRTILWYSLLFGISIPYPYHIHTIYITTAIDKCRIAAKIAFGACVATGILAVACSDWGWGNAKPRKNGGVLGQLFVATAKSSDGSVSKPCTPVVHIKIAGKWMFIPLKMVLIGIDPYPNHQICAESTKCSVYRRLFWGFTMFHLDRHRGSPSQNFCLATDWSQRRGGPRPSYPRLHGLHKGVSEMGIP